MRVTALFHGILSEWLGTERTQFELEDGALFSDLLSKIYEGYHHIMTDQLWNDEKRTFVKSVQALSHQRHVKNHDDPLSDGQEFEFFLMLAGG